MKREAAKNSVLHANFERQNINTPLHIRNCVNVSMISS